MGKCHEIFVAECCIVIFNVLIIEPAFGYHQTVLSSGG